MATLHLGLFAVSVTIILMMVYRLTTGVVEHQMERTIADEMGGLREQYDLRGMSGLVEAVRLRSQVPHTNSIYVLVAPDDVSIAGNLPYWPSQITPDERGWVHFEVSDYGGAEDQPATARAIVLGLPDHHRLLVGRDMSELDTLRRRMVGSLGWVLGTTMLLGLVGGVLLSHGVLHRIEEINRTTRQIMGGDLSRRVPRNGSDDEVDRLAANLNDMLAQIERLMNGMRQVSESIAHDLRTPLTRMRSRIELILLHGTAGESTYREAFQDTLVDADRLLATFTALLSIAEAESGVRRADFRLVDLAALARLSADLYEPVAEEKGLRFALDIPQALMVRGNEQLLAQALANLLDNAIKYTPTGGRVSLMVSGPAHGLGPAIAVADNGPGIPEDMRDMVLQRFVRLESARASPGSGLGLSLVEAVAHLHDGQLILDDNHPGLKITVRLPPPVALEMDWSDTEAHILPALPVA
jgi:signal transduction histidine kinase